MREALLNLIDVPEGFDPCQLSEEQLLHWLALPDGSYPGLNARALEPLISATLAQMRHFRRWRFAPYPGPVHYLAAALTTGPVPHRQALLGAASGPVHWHSIEATHLGLLDAAHIPSIAAIINQLTQEAEYAYSY
jgi:thioesterase domain-containing protein